MRIPPTFPGERRADMAGAADGIYMHPRAAERLRGVANRAPGGKVSSLLRGELLPIFERETMRVGAWAIIVEGKLVASGSSPGSLAAILRPDVIGHRGPGLFGALAKSTRRVMPSANCISGLVGHEACRCWRCRKVDEHDEEPNWPRLAGMAKEEFCAAQRLRKERADE